MNQCMVLKSAVVFTSFLLVFYNFSQAIDMQQKAVMMSERCNGIDHPNTITEYVSRIRMNVS